MPRTLKQSPLSGVTETSMTGSSRPVTPAKEGADRCLIGKFNDSLVFVGKAQFALRAEHASTLDAPDHGVLEGRGRSPGMWLPDGAKTPIMPVRALGAPQTTWDFGVCRFDQAHLKPLGIGVGFRGQHAGGREGSEFTRTVLDPLDLEADAVERGDDLVERSACLEMPFQPCERQCSWFRQRQGERGGHGVSPP